MPFSVPIGFKFACVALNNAGIDRNLQGEMRLGEDTWAVFGPPFQLDDHWREWMGSVQLEHLERASLTIIVAMPSNTPNILDGENRLLRERVLSLFYSLLLVEVFRQEGGLILTGASPDGKIAVRQVSMLESHYRPPGVPPLQVDRGWLEETCQIASGMQAIHATKTHQRLKRGFRAWVRAVQEYDGEGRLHQFVRAVEATTKPDVGRSKAQFTHRGQLFAGNSQSARDLLGELYDLRGAAEHMNTLDSILGAYKAQREEIGLRRSFQAQVLASNVYRRVFANALLHPIFSTDEQIDRLWDKPWGKQVDIWGKAIDLEAIATQRFRFDLAR